MKMLNILSKVTLIALLLSSYNASYAYGTGQPFSFENNTNKAIKHFSFAGQAGGQSIIAPAQIVTMSFTPLARFQSRRFRIITTDEDSFEFVISDLRANAKVILYQEPTAGGTNAYKVSYVRNSSTPAQEIAVELRHKLVKH